METFLGTLKGIHFPRSGPASASCVVAWRPGLSFWAFRAGRCEQKNAKEELELQKFEHLPQGAQPHGAGFLTLEDSDRLSHSLRARWFYLITSFRFGFFFFFKSEIMNGLFGKKSISLCIFLHLMQG